MRIPSPERQRTASGRRPVMATCGVLFCLLAGSILRAQENGAGTAESDVRSFLSVREMMNAGGTVGYLIAGLSFLMVALIIDYLLQIRRVTFMPPGLAEEIHRCLAERKFDAGVSVCQKHHSFLSRVLKAGLEEANSGSYSVVEKAMEDAAVEQSARYFRRVEYLGVISTLAPMLGLMGTVWGMILAFMEFEIKANPQISELAPGVYKALITTLQGLGVAIPATAALAFFRSRVEELAAESTLLASHAFADFRRGLHAKRRVRPPGESGHPE